MLIIHEWAGFLFAVVDVVANDAIIVLLIRFAAAVFSVVLVLIIIMISIIVIICIKNVSFRALRQKKNR
jgi:hypothetical protein